ncbi:MAG: serine/threonine-protein kinase [Myxococcota bacterium]
MSNERTVKQDAQGQESVLVSGPVAPWGNHETETLDCTPQRNETAHSDAVEEDSHNTQERIAARVRQRLFQRSPPAVRFGQFTVQDTIGRGGMGIVYAAYDQKLDRKVAVKVLLEERSGPEARRRFLREAQAMARLSHPNVVTVHEVGESDGEVYVAMEFIRGQSIDAWIQTKPSWAEVLAVFVQAGQGLIAAHEVGLVHRDLKPHNIMRGEDGVVKVLDFGLARAINEEFSETLEDIVSASGSGSLLASSFTRPGTVMGTPAYMSPEQLRGRPADARSDQFSFCVALYEALYGERPYEGRSLDALLASIYRDGVRPAPKNSRVPTAVRRVLLRGLAPHPDGRWPSMEALLEPLRQRVAPRRRSLALPSVVVGLLGLGVGMTMDHYTTWTDRCTGAQSQLEGIWDDGRRQQTKAALLGTALPYALDTWQRVGSRLDDYAADWADAYTEACEATAVRHEQSEEHLGLRMGCLQARRRHLEATVDVLTRPDPRVVEHAVQAVTNLPPLSRCAEVDVLAAQVPPPEDPVVAARVTTLDGTLVQAQAMQEAGRYDEALALADTVVTEATALGHEPLLARARLRQGLLREHTGAYEAAVVALRQAYDAATAQDLTDEAAAASAQLTYVLGSILARHDEARQWGVHADPLSRAVRTDEARALYLRTMGTVASSQGRYDEAQALAQQALKIQRKALGPDHPKVALTLSDLSHVASSKGRYDEARTLARQALEIWHRVLGPDHPETATALDNLSTVLEQQGRYKQAHDLTQRALTIWQRALGADHPKVAGGLNKLGTIFELQGQYDQARDYYRRAQMLWQRALGSDHPHVAGALTNLGVLAHAQGQYDQARDAHERALEIWEQTLGPDHPQVAGALNNLGNVHRSQGKLDEARTLFERARKILVHTLGPDHPHVSLTLTNLGLVASAQGKLDEARALFERSRRGQQTGPITARIPRLP